MRHTFLVFASLLSSLYFSIAHARVDIAFVPMRKADGSIYQFEEGGHFGHIAVSYRGRWLHAHPIRGVELTEDLTEFGNELLVLTSESYEEPTDKFVESHLGKAFSYLRPWDDENFSYCAKLVAQVFNIQPSVMTFASKDWQRKFVALPRGREGLSADDLFAIFTKLGFKIRENSCVDYLQPTPGQIRLLYDAK